jgi:hypothetical protein
VSFQTQILMQIDTLKNVASLPVNLHIERLIIDASKVNKEIKKGEKISFFPYYISIKIASIPINN